MHTEFVIKEYSKRAPTIIKKQNNTTLLNYQQFAFD